MWLGIDIGTCSSSAAIVLRGLAIPVRIGYAALSVPSSVYVTEDGRRLIGQEAEDLGLDDPGHLQRQFKRDVGSDRPYVLRRTSIRPDELVADVMRRLRARAEAQLAIDQQASTPSLRRAVVTVPATYGQHRRDAMVTAARQAGFEQVELLIEPVAACCYLVSKQPGVVEEGKTLLVYDLGGGTFDAALMQKRGATFEPLASPIGNDEIGGTFFDAMIFADVRQRAPDALRGQLAGADGELIQRRALHWLEIECQRLKQRLSHAEEARIYFQQEPHKPYVLTRRTFENMIAPTIAETLELCHRLVASADSEQPIAGILLVGGSCRIPYLQREIARELQRPACSIDDPALAVSLGAALYGYTLETTPPKTKRGPGFPLVTDNVFRAFEDESGR